MDADRSLAALLRLSTQVVEAVATAPADVEAVTVTAPDRGPALAAAGAPEHGRLHAAAGSVVGR